MNEACLFCGSHPVGCMSWKLYLPVNFHINILLKALFRPSVLPALDTKFLIKRYQKHLWNEYNIINQPYYFKKKKKKDTSREYESVGLRWGPRLYRWLGCTALTENHHFQPSIVLPSRGDHSSSLWRLLPWPSGWRLESEQNKATYSSLPKLTEGENNDTHSWRKSCSNTLIGNLVDLLSWLDLCFWNSSPSSHHNVPSPRPLP